MGGELPESTALFRQKAENSSRIFSLSGALKGSEGIVIRNASQVALTSEYLI